MSSRALSLPTVQREQVFSRILQILPKTVEVAADIFVHLARRTDEQ